MVERSLRESRVEAERMLLATRSALAADGDLLERRRARARSTRCWRAVEARARRAPTTTRSTRRSRRSRKGTEAFAAERMNRGIRQALAGRRVEDV